jgi:hypothetical protein
MTLHAQQRAITMAREPSSHSPRGRPRRLPFAVAHVRIVPAKDIPADHRREVLRRLGDVLLKGIFRMAGDKGRIDERPPGTRDPRRPSKH